jgi:Cas6b C-terminal domain/Cas6b N-terminal domain
MTTQINIATISFPEITLPTRAAHQLRGYFGDIFKEHSPLLHNHYDDGTLRYSYPLVQYKVIGGMPVLVGIEEGAKLLAELFFQMQTLQLNGKTYSVNERDISFKKTTVGVGSDLLDYRFETLYMPLNQGNHAEYLEKTPEEQRGFLGRILVGNILSFYKGIGLFLPPEARIMVSFRPEKETTSGFKDNQMLVFKGSFTSNAILPDWIGVGKSVSRGYGAIKQM